MSFPILYIIDPPRIKIPEMIRVVPVTGFKERAGCEILCAFGREEVTFGFE